MSIFHMLYLLRGVLVLHLVVVAEGQTTDPRVWLTLLRPVMADGVGAVGDVVQAFIELGGLVTLSIRTASSWLLD